MTTLLAEQNAGKLAIYGGPRAVVEPYRERWRRVRPSDLRAIARFARRDVNTSVGGDGPIGQFEERFRQLTGTRYALAMNSGTATLHSAYFAVGVKPGDEVIVPAYTFFASAAPVLQLGGTPVFCDIDERTLTADPEDVERRITSRTRAICVVHVWGNPARLDRLAEIAKRHHVALIEDCSHAHGAVYQGKPVGSWGHVGCFSLQGEKPVSAGEGGIAVTDDPLLYDRMLVLGHYGRPLFEQKANSFQTDNLSLGLKYRPHLYGILLATGSLARLGELNELRRRNYDLLRDALQGCQAVATIDAYPDAIRGGLLEFILRYRPEKAGGWNREAFVKAAQAEGVPIACDRYTQHSATARLLHETSLFRDLPYSEFGGSLASCRHNNVPAGSFPAAECIANQLLTLPPFTKVKKTFVQQCGQALVKVADIAARGGDLRS